MLAKEVLTEEWLADVLQDSLEMDWTTTDGARAIMKALERGLVELPQTGGQIAALATTPPTTNDAIPAGEMTLSQVIAEAKRVGLLMAKCVEVNATELQHWRDTITWLAALSAAPSAPATEAGEGA